MSNMNYWNNLPKEPVEASPVEQELLYCITPADVDKFLENIKTICGNYCHEKMSMVAHRRLVNNHGLVPGGLTMAMTLLIHDLEVGKDGYDPKETMPTIPMASAMIRPDMYPQLWAHLPSEFVAAMSCDLASMDIKNQCSMM